MPVDEDVHAVVLQIFVVHVKLKRVHRVVNFILIEVGGRVRTRERTLLYQVRKRNGIVIPESKKSREAIER